jgi:hypothetical protein
VTDLGVDERRVATEAIATLCHVKRVMADLLLKPAGVPHDVYGPLLYRRDETGRLLSKRQIAPLIIEACDQRHEARNAVRRLVPGRAFILRMTSTPPELPYRRLEIFWV